MGNDSNNGALNAPSNFLRGIIDADTASDKYANRTDAQGKPLPNVILPVFRPSRMVIFILAMQNPFA
jgi:hypothetical protein